METIKFSYLYFVWVCLSLAFIAYDAFFATRELTFFACLAWLLTLVAFFNFKNMVHQVSLFLKIASLVILAYVAFISYGNFIDYFSQFFNAIDNRALKITALIFQSAVSAIFVGLMVSLPLASLFEKRILIPSILVCIPVLIYSLEGIFTTTKIIAQLLMGFKIFANIFFVWLSVVACKKYLTNRSSIAPTVLDSF